MDGLRDIYPAPSGIVVDKQLDRIDRHAAHFIARSPFVVVATADAEGRCDASPRGDAPGFVTVADERTLLLPDRLGNNRVDSMCNLASNPHLGLLFMIPGILETLRVNGRAELTTDAETLSRLSAQGKAPKSALVIAVEEVFFHCGKAMKRSELWNPERHAKPGEIPSLGRIIADQVRGVDVAEAEARIETAYRERLY
jgi:hypothetical protein